MTIELPVAKTAIASRRPAGLSARADSKATAEPGFSWGLVVIAFVVIAGIVLAKAWLTAGNTPLINDTDDAMRMVTMHDLLAGQNWFDHIQHRLNTPFGAEIHWSHLIDAAIGAIVLPMRPLFGAARADVIAACAWPLLLLFCLLALCARLAFRLAGREAVLPALVLPAVSPALLYEFSPGRVDHDSVQILLTLLMAWAVIEAMARPRFAILAGLASALSLTIGIEGLPSVVSALLALALIWVANPARADALRGFGVSFALGTVLLFAEALPPSQWFLPACDEISIVYVAFAIGTGLALLLLSALPIATRPAGLRLAVGGLVGGGLALALAVAFPQCLHGPYAAVDPWLVDNWLNQIAEAKPLWDSLKGFDAFTIGVSVPPLLGLLVTAIAIWRGPAENRGAWAIIGLFLAIAVAVMVIEIRGARTAAPLALPAAGWLIALARRRYLSGKRWSGAAALLASWLGFAGLVIALAVVIIMLPFETPADAAATAQGVEARACLQPQAFAPLADLPPTRVMTPIDLGSHLLLFTPHSVVAAPYHRDQQGLFDAYHFFNGPIAAARQILARRDVTLVVVCPAMPEMRGLSTAAPDSFVKLFAARRLPKWLEPISAPNAVLKVYRVAWQ